MADSPVDNYLETAGIIFLAGEIDFPKAESTCKQILFFNSKNDVPHIKIIVSSCGGLTAPAFAISDMMEWSRLPVHTLGMGIIASAGLSVFIAGERGERTITPNTSILSHQYAWSIEGNHAQLMAQRKEMELLHQRMVHHYIKNTKLKTEQEIKDKLLCDHDVWLSDREAVELGVADKIE
jgi:ATP-dependent Clp protease protease subunit